MRKKLLCVLALVAVTFHLQAQKMQYATARIALDKAHTVEQLIASGISADHGNYKKGRFVESVFSYREIDLARDLGYRVDIIHPDAIKYYLENVKDRPASRNAGPCDDMLNDYEVPSNFNLGSMGGFLTYEELLSELDDMHDVYPDLITEKAVIPGFQTFEGRPLYWLKISDNPNSDESEPEILYTAVHHAREPESMQQLVFFMWYLLENYNSDPEIHDLVDHTEFYFIPMVNPDGYIYNQVNYPSGGGMWRKNRRDNGNGSFGVDLNRNYSYHWNEAGTSDSWGETYAGPSPFSEPETQAVKWMVNHHDFVMALNNHTYSRLLLYPYGYAEDTPTPDDALYQEFTGYMVSHNGYTNEISSSLYPAAGDSDDWMYGDTSEHDKIFAMTPEIGYSFWLAQEDIIPICKEMMFLNLSAAHLIHNYASIEDNSAGTWSDLSGDFTYHITGRGLAGNGNFNVSATPVSSNITFNGGSHNFTLDFGQSQEDSFSYTLDSGIATGDDIAFRITVDNGEDSMDYEFHKTYGQLTNIFTDACENMNHWQSSSWGTTASDYYSASHSITDSPGGYYPYNANNVIQLSQSLNLTGAQDAQISFYAKWAIEAGFDYVQFQVSNDGGNTWIPQCGIYTHNGVQYQSGAEGEPVYDGIQNDWVREEISLTDYLGEEILFRFVLVSDGYEEYDGFYVDDVEVNVVGENIDIVNHPVQNIRWYPNPASAQISFTGIHTKAHLDLYDTMGRNVFSGVLDGAHSRVDISRLDSGVYFFNLTLPSGVKSGKIIKE